MGRLSRPMPPLPLGPIAPVDHCILPTQALLKTHIGPHATTQVFDEDAALYKTIFGYINFRTWGMQREPLNWLAMKAKLAELEAAAAHSGGSESD